MPLTPYRCSSPQDNRNPAKRQHKKLITFGADPQHERSALEQHKSAVKLLKIRKIAQQRCPIMVIRAYLTFLEIERNEIRTK